MNIPRRMSLVVSPVMDPRRDLRWRTRRLRRLDFGRPDSADSNGFDVGVFFDSNELELTRRSPCGSRSEATKNLVEVRMQELYSISFLYSV